MSSETAIRVNSLSKCYEVYSQPRHRLMQMLFRGKKQFFREFWALRDVSFEIARGETVGIIGRNGAGKSTLLQMLCGTLQPTSGTIDVKGRVAALLELGAGFNPEFTGRENVFLSASLYGMRHEQIDERFDQIAAFADIGGFIDQPVKTYSTGMFVRLAFAVQVHLDPEIFVIDEALAVGDQRFVQKCYRKLEELKSRGTSLLLVSHDTTAIKMLSDRALWIHDGKLQKIGPASAVVDAYRNWADKISELPTDLSSSKSDASSNRIDIHSVRMRNQQLAESFSFTHGEYLSLEASITNLSVPQGSPLRLGFSIRNNRGVEICGSNTQDSAVELNAPKTDSSFTLQAGFALPLLARGEYSISLNVDSMSADGSYVAEVTLPDHIAFQVDETVKVHTLIGIDVGYRKFSPT